MYNFRNEQTILYGSVKVTFVVFHIDLYVIKTHALTQKTFVNMHVYAYAHAYYVL